MRKPAEDQIDIVTVLNETEATTLSTRDTLNRAAIAASNAVSAAARAGSNLTVSTAAKAGALSTQAVVQVGVAAQTAAKSARTTAKGAAAISGRATKTVRKAAVMIGDLNGDGQVDEADLRLARDAAGKVAAALSTEAGTMGKTILRHEMTKDAAAGAALGAIIAVPIPFVGPALGAAVGAAFAVTRGVLGSPASETLAGHVVSTTVDATASMARGRASIAPSKPARRRRTKSADPT